MRKGITPVVAIILLLLMTIAAAGAAYIWVTRLQGTLEETSGGGISDTQRRTNTRLSIENIYNESTYITAVLRNIGTYDLVADDLKKVTIYMDEVLYPLDQAFQFNDTDGDPLASLSCGFVNANASGECTDLEGTGGNNDCLTNYRHYQGNLTGYTFREGETIKLFCYGPIYTEDTQTLSLKIEPAFGSGDVRSYRSAGTV